MTTAQTGPQTRGRPGGPTMLAAVLEDVKRMPLREVPKPRPLGGEVLLRVEACGICGTDYSAYTGRRRDWEPGSILGHEFAGVVEELGEGVEENVNGWKVGDEAAVNPVVFCGECRPCRLGMQHYCEHGQVIGGEGQEVKRAGAFAEYVAVPTQCLHRKPANIGWDAAAETEPLAGAYKGMIEYSQLRTPEDVVIIGAGTMGLLLLQVAIAGGAGRVIVADISDERLAKAMELGATHTVHSEKQHLKKRVYDIVPGGPDIVFEAAGVLPAARQAFELTRRGTRINMFGVIIPGEVPISPADVHWKETRMDASFSVTPRVMVKSLELMERGKADPTKIVTHRFPLSRMQEALDAMEAPERVKIMIHTRAG